MPTYVYKFTDTGETIEIQQAFTDDALTEAVHPATGATMAVRKVFLPVGVTFRGGGFYKTDSRGPGAKSKTPSDTTSGDTSSNTTSSEKSGSSDTTGSETAGSKTAGSSSSDGNGSSANTTASTAAASSSSTSSD